MMMMANNETQHSPFLVYNPTSSIYNYTPSQITPCAPSTPKSPLPSTLSDTT